MNKWNAVNFFALYDLFIKFLYIHTLIMDNKKRPYHVPKAHNKVSNNALIILSKEPRHYLDIIFHTTKQP